MRDVRLNARLGVCRSPVVSGLASYRILDDSWEWRREVLVHMPDKIWRKLLAAGVNPEDVVREVLGNGES